MEPPSDWDFPEPIKTMTAKTSRALVVEDDRSWQQIVSEILTDCGLEVDTVSDLESAVQTLKGKLHRLVVVDLSLSPSDHNNTDGLRVLENVRRLEPNCQTILLTGFATVELAVTALTQYGTFTFLRKENFQRAQFREIVYRALATAPHSENVSERLTEDSKNIPIKAKIIASDETPAGKALIVEDDAGWRSILAELLMEAGFQVITSASFGDAHGFLLREKFTLAVIDLSLGEFGKHLCGNNTSNEDLEGYKLLSSAHGGNIPTIVVSGMASPDGIKSTYDEHHIFAYLEKQSFERAAFRRIVEEIRSTYRGYNEFGLLTEREREVLSLLSQGITNKEIAARLTITNNTVKRHLKVIFEKLGVHTRSAAAAKALAKKA